jgi:hypothetical protein
MKMHSRLIKNLIAAALGFTALSLTGYSIHAADHGDAPITSGDQAADLGDVYFFLDPNDNSKAVMIATVRGFIVPGEAVNFGIFDSAVSFEFEIENTGDAKSDLHFAVTFDKRTADPGPSPRPILEVPKAQTATIRLPGGTSFTAPVLNPSLGSTPPSQAVTTDTASGISFFAGEVDDPFFFDIPAFGRFIASVRSGSPDPTLFNRARDTFAGYNIMAIAMRVPVATIKGSGNVIGLDVLSRRPATPGAGKKSKGKGGGLLTQVDRMGNPAVNVALIPFNRKDEYNVSTTLDDANSKFANDIVATLQALGTNAANINTLAGIAVTNGDFVRLNTTIVNTGSGGGNNVEASYPDGRRLQDDVIDILLNIITNGALTTGDGVNANDQTFQDTFPFLAPTQQPRAPGVIDDNTRN